MISRTGASAAAFLTLAVLVAWAVPAASAVGDRVAGEQALLATGVASEVADPEQELAEDPQPVGEATVTELEIVVPPVDGSGEVVADAEVREAQAAPDVVVADEVTGAERVQSDVVETKDFQLLGVTWPADAEASDLDIQVRTRVEGDWTEWVPLEEGDIAPDAGTADAENAVRGGTDSLWVGEADAVQLSFAATEEGGPDGLGLALVDVPEAEVPEVEVPEAEVPETATAAGASFGLPDRLGTIQANQAVFRPEALDAATEQALSTALLGVPSAVASAPRVISRAEWGARPQVCAPDVATQLVGAAVHHTAGSNNYSTVAEAARQIRGDQAYHIDGRGWCDLGYNFVVDKWGNIYEGRANSLTQPVVGVHAGGFNTGTVGVAMLGTYAAAPSAATQEAVAQIIGWRLGAYGVDPQGSTSYTTGVGENSRYQNQTVTLPRVFGHRDVAYTNCPGDGGYAALGNIRALADGSSYGARFAQAGSVVRAMYEDILLRGVDPSGLATWTAVLAGGSGLPTLVAMLTDSDEYILLRIRQAYRDVLGRVPDPGGLVDWHREIRAGRATVDDVARRFLSSEEFRLRSGGTDRGYVVQMYSSVLGRAAAGSEVEYWTREIGRLGRDRVTDGIWFSVEAARHRAGVYYQTFLKRGPDPSGQAAWADVLLRSGEGAVRIGIAGSEEYRLRALARFP